MICAACVQVAEVAALRARFGAVVDPVMVAMDALAQEAQSLLAELSRNATAHERVFTDLEVTRPNRLLVLTELKYL